MPRKPILKPLSIVPRVQDDIIPCSYLDPPEENRFEADNVGSIDYSNIWVGGVMSIYDISNIQKNGIRVIINVAKEIDTPSEYSNLMYSDPELKNKLAEYLSQDNFFPIFILLKAEDESDYPLILKDNAYTDQFKAVLDCMDIIKGSCNILINCKGGISRAPTIAAALMAVYTKTPVNEVLDSISAVRPKIDPNLGFILQLEAIDSI